MGTLRFAHPTIANAVNLDVAVLVVSIASMTRAPSFRQIFHSIWAMTSDAVRLAPHLVLLFISILIAVELAKIPFPDDGLANKVARQMVDFGRCTATAPLQFAFYRLFVLAELPSSYRFDVSVPRFRRFLLWSLLFELSIAPISLFTLASTYGVSDEVIMIAGIVLIIAFLYVGLRLVLLLPAIAAGPDRVSWRDAWADSRRSWRLFKIMLYATILITAIYISAVVVARYAGLDSNVTEPSDWRVWVQALVDGVMGIIIEIPFLAAAALSFIWVGDRVKRNDERRHPPIRSV